MNILKADEIQQIVYGWAGQYLDENGQPLEDLQGDIVSPEEIEKASYDYVLNKRESGVMHEGKNVGHIVASFVTTPDVVKAFFGDGVKVPCGWIIGVKYPDKDVFKKVVSGELAMFSIQGNADRVEVDDDDEDLFKSLERFVLKWIDKGGPGSGRHAQAASRRANAATQRARQTGGRRASNAAHATAARLHSTAARLHRAAGNVRSANLHQQSAAAHLASASGSATGVAAPPMALA